MLCSKGAPPLILIVDDDEDIRTTATTILTLDGYTIQEAENGQTALDLIRTGACTPDLIVSDIAMPFVDGYRFFEEVRQIPHLRFVPFIFLTAYGSRRHLLLGRELGVDDYLVKPFDPEHLLASVRSKLRRSRQLWEHVEDEFKGVRRQLIQVLSHELNTPLHHITGGFELLAASLSGEGNPEDTAIGMEIIGTGTRRLNRFAGQFIRYADLISGNARRHLEQRGETISAQYIVETALQVAAEDFTTFQANFSLYAPPDSLEVFGLSDMLVTAVYEVIRNAIHYGPVGGRVKITLQKAGDFAQIAVQDQGRGISAKDQESIWEVLSQIDRIQNEQQGSGMGLPIVKQTVLLHGGTVSLQSELGKGTLVILSLPLHRA
jgi:signal transduction histidine kinase